MKKYSCHPDRVRDWERNFSDVVNELFVPFHDQVKETVLTKCHSKMSDPMPTKGDLLLR